MKVANALNYRAGYAVSRGKTVSSVVRQRGRGTTSFSALIAGMTDEYPTFALARAVLCNGTELSGLQGNGSLLILMRE